MDKIDTPYSYILGETAIGIDVPETTYTPDCGYGSTSIDFNNFADLIVVNPNCGDLVPPDCYLVSIYGLETQDSINEQIELTVTITLDDSDNSEWTVALLDLTVLDCYPEFSWLNYPTLS